MNCGTIQIRDSEKTGVPTPYPCRDKSLSCSVEFFQRQQEPCSMCPQVPLPALWLLHKSQWTWGSLANGIWLKPKGFPWQQVCVRHRVTNPSSIQESVLRVYTSEPPRQIFAVANDNALCSCVLFLPVPSRSSIFGVLWQTRNVLYSNLFQFSQHKIIHNLSRVWERTVSYPALTWKWRIPARGYERCSWQSNKCSCSVSFASSPGEVAHTRDLFMTGHIVAVCPQLRIF